MREGGLPSSARSPQLSEAWRDGRAPSAFHTALLSEGNSSIIYSDAGRNAQGPGSLLVHEPFEDRNEQEAIRRPERPCTQQGLHRRRRAWLPWLCGWARASHLMPYAAVPGRAGLT